MRVFLCPAFNLIKITWTWASPPTTFMQNVSTAGRRVILAKEFPASQMDCSFWLFAWWEVGWSLFLSLQELCFLPAIFRLHLALLQSYNYETAASQITLRVVLFGARPRVPRKWFIIYTFCNVILQCWWRSCFGIILVGEVELVSSQGLN